VIVNPPFVSIENQTQVIRERISEFLGDSA